MPCLLCLCECAPSGTHLGGACVGTEDWAVMKTVTGAGGEAHVHRAPQGCQADPVDGVAGSEGFWPPTGGRSKEGVAVDQGPGPGGPEGGGQGDFCLGS